MMDVIVGSGSATRTGTLTKLVGNGRVEVFQQHLPDVKEDGILLEIGLAGICGTDIHIIDNAEGPEFRSGLPFTLGHEVTGTICEIGPRASESMFCDEPLRKGDKVVLYVFLPCGNCWWERNLGTSHNLICSQPRSGYFGNPHEWPYFESGWGEYMYVQPGSWLWRIPEDMPFEVSVLAEPFAMGIRAVQKAMALPAWKNLEMLSFGGTVAVLGSGAIGVLTAIAAKIAGAGKVVLIGGPQKTLDIAASAGAADVTMDIAAVSPEERIAKVRELSDGGYGADVTFEAAGVPQAFVEGLEMTRKEGTFVELGCLIDDGRTVGLNVSRLIVGKDITLYGVTNQPPQDFSKALKCLRAFGDRFDYASLLTHVFELDQMDEAISLARDPERKGIKAAFKGKGYK